MRIRVYSIKDGKAQFGIRYDDEKRFAPVNDLYDPIVFANCREVYLYENCGLLGFLKHEVIADYEVDQEVV